MHRIGHPTPLIASEFLCRGREVIPDWYRVLLSLTRAQVISVQPPLLDLAPQPFADDKELARVELLQEVGFISPDLQ